jgi:N-acetylneuraminic acid mutarotase
MRTLFILFLVLSGSVISAQNTWTQKTVFGGGNRYWASSFEIGTKGYFCSGQGGSVFYNDLWEYDAVLNSWSQKASYAGNGRIRGVGFSIGQKAYFGSGWNSITTQFFSDFYEYDPVANAWTAKANCPGSQREGAFGFGINGKGYLGAGWDGGGFSPVNYLDDVWEYDPVLNSWTSKATFSGVGRHIPAFFTFAGIGFVGVGETSTGYLTDFHAYDPASNSWTVKPILNGGPRNGASGMAINGRGFICSGRQGNSYLADLWEYNGTLDQWIQRASVPGNPRMAGAAFSVNGKGYFGSGYNSGNELSDFWEYAPSPNGISDHSNSLEVDVFPSPSQGDISFTFQHAQFPGDLKILISDINLKVIIERKIENESDLRLTGLNLANGVYYFMLQQEDKLIAVKKFIIAK